MWGVDEAVDDELLNELCEALIVELVVAVDVVADDDAWVLEPPEPPPHAVSKIATLIDVKKYSVLLMLTPKDRFLLSFSNIPQNVRSSCD